MGVKMEVAGMDALLRSLRDIAGTAAAAVERQVLERAAEVIRLDAVARVSVRTGKLRDNIIVSSLKRDKDRASIRIGVPKGAGVDYARPLEYGHKNRDGTVTAPRPFMGPAYESKKAEAYAIIRDGLQAALRGGGDEA